MLYLEDYLEIIENLPHELRDRFTLMRELDLTIHNDKDKLDARVDEFFSKSADLPPDILEKEYRALQQDYAKTLETADEKVAISNQLYDLVDKYLRKLDSDLHKFKIELEADNAGITEILEKRSLEMDNTPSTHYTREKRKHSAAFPSGNGKHDNLNEKTHFNNSSNGYNVGTTLNNLNLNRQTKMSSNPTPTIENTNSLAIFNSNKLSNGKNNRPLSGHNAIAAAASQAILATQQLPFGRRSSSLKASYEAINNSNSSNAILTNFYNQIRPDEADNSVLVGNNTTGNSRNSTNGINDDQTNRLKKARMKRGRSSNYIMDPTSNNVNNAGSSSYRSEYHLDEPLYCICQNISYGNMIFCENKQCTNQWFHYDCVGIKVPPEGSWYCRDCSSSKDKKK